MPSCCPTPPFSTSTLWMRYSRTDSLESPCTRVIIKTSRPFSMSKTSVSSMLMTTCLLPLSATSITDLSSWYPRLPVLKPCWRSSGKVGGAYRSSIDSVCLFSAPSSLINRSPIVCTNLYLFSFVHKCKLQVVCCLIRVPVLGVKVHLYGSPMINLIIQTHHLAGVILCSLICLSPP